MIDEVVSNRESGDENGDGNVDERDVLTDQGFADRPHK